jgi:hypothetical protein
LLLYNRTIVRIAVRQCLVVLETLNSELIDPAAKTLTKEEHPISSGHLEAIEFTLIAIDKIGLTNHTEII